MSIPQFKDDQEYLLFWSRKLTERAARLQRLVELKAPSIILASERELVFKALLRIPVDGPCLRELDNVSSSLEEEEQEHLLKTGFYKEFENKGSDEH